MNGAPDESRKTVTVVCEKHGLRYNPEIHSGCVRCRKEAGEQIGGAAPKVAGRAGAGRAGAGRAAATSGSGSLVAALAVAFLLVAVSSGLLYLAHKASWEDAMEARERWMQEGMEELTPEQQEQLRKLEEMLDSISDP